MPPRCKKRVAVKVSVPSPAKKQSKDIKDERNDNGPISATKEAIIMDNDELESSCGSHKIVRSDFTSLDISQLLALGEKLGNNSCDLDGNISDSDESGFEEVEAPFEISSITQNGIDITLDGPVFNFKKKSKKSATAEEIKQRIWLIFKRRQREIQVMAHKAHLVCWIAHFQIINNIMNSPILQAQALSIVFAKYLYPPKRANLKYLERFLKWFKDEIVLEKGQKNADSFSRNDLIFQFAKRSAKSKKDLVCMFIVILRSLGLQARLVTSLVTVPMRLSCRKLLKMKNEDSDATDSESDSEYVTKGIKIEPSSSKRTKTNRNHVATIKKSENGKDSSKWTLSRDGNPVVFQIVKGKKLPKRRKEVSNEIDRRVFSTDEESVFESDESSSEEDVKPDPVECKPNVVTNEIKSQESPKKIVMNETKPERKPLRLNKSNVSYKVDVDEMSHSSSSEVEDSEIKKEITFSASSDDDWKPTKGKKKKKESSGSEDNDLTEESDDSLANQLKADIKRKQTASSVKKKQKTVKRRKSNNGPNKKVISNNLPKLKIGQDYWVEVFLNAEEKWISVDVVSGKIQCISELYAAATRPVTYVLACNNDSTLKDVTKRYVPDFHSDTRKRRVAEQWWQNTLKPYLPASSSVFERKDDESMAKQLQNMPIPTSISECKSHPMYALQRHLLKFEALYPPDAPPLGFIGKEPVYARECVVTLRSRDMWFKEARVVRANETPYKYVKARPKYDKMTGEYRTDLSLELFGFWQTDEYVPPVAVNGIVPRNEYGNVDLFKPCMLPVGTIHLQIPALNRIARKLGIDCVPAIVGFEYHKRFRSHPVQDGFVICEEYKYQLANAWRKEVVVAERRAKAKFTNRIYGNWRRLIRGLFIREKLKMKYAFGEDFNDPSPVSSTTVNPSAPKGAKERGTIIKNVTPKKRPSSCKRSSNKPARSSSTFTKRRVVAESSSSDSSDEDSVHTPPIVKRVCTRSMRKISK